MNKLEEIKAAVEKFEVSEKPWEAAMESMVEWINREHLGGASFLLDPKSPEVINYRLAAEELGSLAPNYIRALLPVVEAAVAYLVSLQTNDPAINAHVELVEQTKKLLESQQSDGVS